HQGSGRHVRGTRPGQGLHGSSSWDLADERGEAAQDRAEERKLLFLMLRDESRIPAVAETLAPELITSPVYRELFEELVRTGGLQGRGPLALELSAEARAKLEELLGDRTELGDADRVFRELVANLRAQKLFDRIDALQAQLSERRG